MVGFPSIESALAPCSYPVPASSGRPKIHDQAIAGLRRAALPHLPPALARNSCRVLVHTTISLTGAEIAADGHSPEAFAEVFENTIRWVVLGIQTDAI